MIKLILGFSVVSCALAQIYNQYQPPNGGKFIGILRQHQDLRPDGSYDWEYETENGITAQEQGQIRGKGDDAIIEVQGQYSYTSPEGQKIQISYVADDTGFHPSGDLPTPPPIPPAILRSLQWNAAHPEEEAEDSRPPVDSESDNRRFG